MNRGIVMQVAGKNCIIMTPDGEFKKVPRRGKYRVGDEVVFDTPYVRSRIFKPVWISAVAAILLFIIVLPQLGLFGAANDGIAAYVALDINPSVEMGIDTSGNVVELTARNRDGKVVIEGLIYKGKPAEEVTALVMERVQTGGYLASGDGDVVITSVIVKAGNAGKFEETITGKMDQAVKESLAKGTTPKEHVKVTVLNAPKELREVSEAEGVSMGKMAVYLLANDEGHQVPLAAFRHKSIHRVTEAWGGLESVVGKKENKENNRLKLAKLVETEQKMLLNKKKAAESGMANGDGTKAGQPWTGPGSRKHLVEPAAKQGKNGENQTGSELKRTEADRKKEQEDRNKPLIEERKQEHKEDRKKEQEERQQNRGGDRQKDDQPDSAAGNGQEDKEKKSSDTDGNDADKDDTDKSRKGSDSSEHDGKDDKRKATWDEGAKPDRNQEQQDKGGQRSGKEASEGRQNTVENVDSKSGKQKDDNRGKESDRNNDQNND
jgi:hypothetical protein